MDENSNYGSREYLRIKTGTIRKDSCLILGKNNLIDQGAGKGRGNPAMQFAG